MADEVDTVVMMNTKNLSALARDNEQLPYFRFCERHRRSKMGPVFDMNCDRCLAKTKEGRHFFDGAERDIFIRMYTIGDVLFACPEHTRKNMFHPRCTRCWNTDAESKEYDYSDEWSEDIDDKYNLGITLFPCKQHAKQYIIVYLCDECEKTTNEKLGVAICRDPRRYPKVLKPCKKHKTYYCTRCHDCLDATNKYNKK